MDLNNFTLTIKQQPLSPEEAARMQSTWNKMRQVWREPVTITFTVDPQQQEETNTVVSTAIVLPLEEEQPA